VANEFEYLHQAFNIEDRVFSKHFEDMPEHLVGQCPVARSQVGPGYYVFNRYRDVRRIGQDWRTFSSADGWMLEPPEGNIPILAEDSDPPYHTAWRQVLNPYLNAKAVAQLEDHARGYDL
jgi:cytochrome P450